MSLDRRSLLRLPLAAPAARVLASLPDHTWAQPPDHTIRPDAVQVEDLGPAEDPAPAERRTLDASCEPGEPALAPPLTPSPPPFDPFSLSAEATDATLHAPAASPSGASVRGVPGSEWLPRLSISERGERADASGAFCAPSADYELIDELGSGGMGVVWRAHQHTLRREVAIKRAKLAVQGAGALLHEARVTGGLEHPHIIPVHALGLDQQQHPVLVMKRVEGVVWRALIQDPDHPWWPKLSPGADRIAWHIERLMQVCDAVAFAHERGVIHRDIKPDNVMIGAFGEVYVLDWGVALTLSPASSASASPAQAAPTPSAPPTGRLRPQPRFSFVGTPAYMAPEMVNGDAPISARSDVYLLGATLYEVLTGQPPHRGGSVLEVLHRASQGEPPPLSSAQAHPALAEVCARAMSPDPDARYATAQDLKRALRDYLHRRAAHRLLERAEGLLTDLARAVQRPSAAGAPPGQPAEAQRLFIECRFALQQALSESPQDAAALAALERALTLMIDAELRAENVPAARALLADLPRPNPSLSAQVEAAEARARDARAELDALRAAAHDMDRSVSSRQRGLLMSGLALFWGALVIGAVSAIRLLGYTPGYPEALGAAVGGLLMALGGMYALRRAFRDHRLNRLVMVIVSTIIAAATLLRALFWRLGLPVLTALNVELVAVALATLVGAITLDKRLVPPALLCMGCGVVGALAPSLSPETYAIGQFGALFWISRVWFRSAPNRAADPPGGPREQQPAP